MAKWQRTERKTDRRSAQDAVGVDPQKPNVMTGQVAVQRWLSDQMMRRIAAPLGDSKEYEIVDPATGKFFKVPDISDPSGTDVDRP